MNQINKDGNRQLTTNEIAEWNQAVEIADDNELFSGCHLSIQKVKVNVQSGKYTFGRSMGGCMRCSRHYENILNAMNNGGISEVKNIKSEYPQYRLEMIRLGKAFKEKTISRQEYFWRINNIEETNNLPF